MPLRLMLYVSAGLTMVYVSRTDAIFSRERQRTIGIPTERIVHRFTAIVEQRGRQGLFGILYASASIFAFVSPNTGTICRALILD